MSDQFAQHRKHANRRFRQRGTDAVWVTQQRTRQEATPWDVHNESSSDTPVRVIFLPDERYRQEASRYIDGTSIEAGRYNCLMKQVDGLSPRVGDKLRYGGNVHRVSAVDPLQPDGRVIMYRVKVDL